MQRLRKIYKDQFQSLDRPQLVYPGLAQQRPSLLLSQRLEESHVNLLLHVIVRVIPNITADILKDLELVLLFTRWI